MTIYEQRSRGTTEWQQFGIHWERRIRGRLLRVIQLGLERPVFEATVYHGDWVMKCARGSRKGAQRAAERLLERVGTKGIR